MLFKNKYRLQTARLADWDYSQVGCYFVTICVKDNQCCFGEIVDAKMKFSVIGKIANKFWLEIPEHFNNAELDVFAIMPNHLHGIIIIQNDCDDSIKFNISKCRAVACRAVACRAVACRAVACNGSTELNFYSKISPKPKSLSAIIRSFKSAVRCWCNRHNFTHFHWQPRFYDHIIRNEKSLNQIRQYILANSRKWEFDKYNSKYEGYN